MIVRRMDLRGTRLLIYFLAAALLLAAAGCGWTSGASFEEGFDPEAYKPAEGTPVTAVQAWFSSMEWKRNADGMRDSELGRDYLLYLTVVNPAFFLDPNGQFAGMEQLQGVEELWNSQDWEVEFLDVQLQETRNEGGEAEVELVSGGIRYIGQFFGTSEYKQDSYGDKKGRIYLEWYDDPVNDPLLKVQEQDAEFRQRFGDVAGRGRWVIMSGLDLSEDKSWGPVSERPPS